MSSLITVLFVLCLVGLALLSARHGAAALIIVAFFFPFENYYQLGLVLTSNELLILALLVGMFLQVVRKRLPLRKLLNVCVPFIPFCIALLISTIVASSKADAIKDIVRWLSFFAVFALANVHIRDLGGAERLAKWLVAASVPASLLGIFQSALGLPSAAFELEPHSRIDSLFCLTTGWHVRAHSFFNQANSFACYLVIVLPLCLFLARRSRTKAGKIGSIAVLSLDLVALMLTFSRAAWPLAAISLLAVVFLSRSSRPEGKRASLNWLKAAVPIAVALVLVGVLFFKTADLGSLLSKHSAVQRVRLYHAGFRIIGERPILGTGPGNYAHAASDIRMGVDEERLKRAHLHNLYLQIAVEVGFVGIVGFLFFVISVVSRSIRGVRMTGSGSARALAASFCVSGCAFFAYNVVDIFRFHGVHLVAAVAMGAGMGLLALNGPRRQAR